MENNQKEQITDEMLEQLTGALENLSLEEEEKPKQDSLEQPVGAPDYKPTKRKKKKKKSKGGKGWLILILICLAVMAFSIYQLLSIFLEYKAGTDEYDELKQYVVSEIPEDGESVTEVPETESEDIDPEETEPEEAEPKPEEERLQRISFSELKKINSDIVGWLEIPGTNISYPVMHGDDNAYYLNHTFKGKVNSAGSIFMEVLNTADFSDYHTLVYGHNMKNGSMFGTLSYYKSPSYLVAHPYIYVDTEYGQQKYQIFSCYETTATSDSYTIGFAPDEVYQNYLNTIKGRSQYDTGVEVSMEDKIISLSTCTKSGEDMRYLVHAKLVP